MKYEIYGQPSYASVRFLLDENEQIKVESGAMIAMDPKITLDAKSDGGILKGLGKIFLTGENFFLTTATAHGKNQELYLAPRSVGDVRAITITPEIGWFVQGGGFLACTNNVTTDTKFSGLKGFFSGEGLFMLKATGEGTMWISSFGAILEKNLDGVLDTEFVVDNSHIVAFEDTLTYEITKSSKGLFSNIKTGEGLVCKFKGKGKILFQTRNLESFATQLNPFMSSASNSGGGSLLGNVFGG